jgi:hypothetical protein
MSRKGKGADWSQRLSAAHLRGQFLITDAAIRAAERLLPTYRGPDGDHEGMVFLLGRELSDLTFFTAALAPDANHGRGHVICSAEAVAQAQQAAREHRLALLGQLHTHPKDWTDHSEGDDDLVFMPFEGMLSIVAPWYGRFGLRPVDSLGVHQFQDGRWVQATRESVAQKFRVIPSDFDLR